MDEVVAALLLSTPDKRWLLAVVEIVVESSGVRLELIESSMTHEPSMARSL